MKTVRVLMLIALCAVRPTAAFAQSDFLDWLDSLSGPGPFHGFTLYVRASCMKDTPNDGWVKGACINDTDPNIKTVLNAHFGWATSGDNPRFADAPAEKLPVHLTRGGVTYMYRVSPLLDVGVGLGVSVMSGDGVDNEVHPILTPFTVTFVPFGMKHKTTKATKLGRVIRLTYSERFIMGKIDAKTNFKSASSYLKNGEFNRGFGVALDFWSLFVR